MQKTTDNIFVLIIIATVGTFVMVVSFILIYVRNKNKLLEQRQLLQQAQLAHQKELLQVVIESQEEERKRIGRDLHDDVGAAISSLRLIIGMLEPQAADDNYRQFVKTSKGIIDKMMTDVRNISHNLSPANLSYYGLSIAIDEHCNIINQSGKLEVAFVNNTSSLLEKLDLPVATALYRVLEELMNNTIKHSKATKSNINFVKEDNMLIIEYADNGLGLDPTIVSRGIGLKNIESRLTVINAPYLIKTAPGEGFYIQIKYQVA